MRDTVWITARAAAGAVAAVALELAAIAAVLLGGWPWGSLVAAGLCALAVVTVERARRRFVREVEEWDREERAKRTARCESLAGCDREAVGWARLQDAVGSRGAWRACEEHGGGEP